MTYEKVTEELVRETKEPVVVEHKKAELESLKAKLQEEKTTSAENYDKRIAEVDEMLAVFNSE